MVLETVLEKNLRNKKKKYVHTYFYPTFTAKILNLTHFNIFLRLSLFHLCAPRSIKNRFSKTKSIE